MNTPAIRYWGTLAVILAAVFIWGGGDLLRGLAEFALTLNSIGK